MGIHVQEVYSQPLSSLCMDVTNGDNRESQQVKLAVESRASSWIAGAIHRRGLTTTGLSSLQETIGRL